MNEYEVLTLAESLGWTRSDLTRYLYARGEEAKTVELLISQYLDFYTTN